MPMAMVQLYICHVLKNNPFLSIKMHTKLTIFVRIRKFHMKCRQVAPVYRSWLVCRVDRCMAVIYLHGRNGGIHWQDM